MALSKQKGRLFDPYRNMWVLATGEEVVRQKLLHVMTEQLGFPKHLIAVERKLSEIVDLPIEVPNRRIDVLCFWKKLGELAPLLLIECKEFEPKEDAVRQVLGYNHFIGAPFVGIAGPSGVSLVYPQKVPFLPTYQAICESASCS